MKKLFKDILEIDNVEGVMFLTFEGEMIYREFSTEFDKESGLKDKKGRWAMLIDALDGAREADAVFEDRRIYIRKAESGYIVVIMDVYAPIAMVRLNCDILLPELKNKKTSKGFLGLFKKN